MAHKAARVVPTALLLGVAACSMPVLADQETDACRTQIKVTSGHDLSQEKPSGWNVKVSGSTRSTVVHFAATDTHPTYICSLKNNAVTEIIEQETIYQLPS